MQRRQFVSLAPGAVVAAAAAPAFLRNAFAQEAGITGKTLTIGCSAALTGPLAGLGQDVKLGAEAALAHTITNAVQAAYERGDKFRKRRELMQAWAEYCAQA